MSAEISACNSGKSNQPPPTNQKPGSDAAVRPLYLCTHENDVCVRPQPINEDLHHLDETLVGQNLQFL